MVLLCVGIAITLLVWFWSVHHVNTTTQTGNWWEYQYPKNKNKNNNQHCDTTATDADHYNSCRVQNEMQQVANSAIQDLNNNYVTTRTGGSENSTTIGSTTTSNPIPDLCETTLLVFRHCDKLDITDEDDHHLLSYNANNNDDTTLLNNKRSKNRHCSDIGYDRAQYITTLFGSNHTNKNTSRWPIPQYLFALSSHRKTYENVREYETLLPLSHMISVPIQNVSGTPSNTFAQQYYFPLLTSQQICGQVSVISWKHHWIPALVNTLGCGPNNGCPMIYPTDTFDAVWELKFIFHSSATTIPNTTSLPRTDTDTINSNATTTTTTTNSQIDDNDAVVVKPSKPTFHLLRKKKKKHHHHNHRHHHYHDDSNYMDVQTQYPFEQNNENHTISTRGHWIVMGTVTYQMFDPLQYSTSTHLRQYNTNP
jgi:hypothetical protein